MAAKKVDRRVQRTRRALLDAFTGLFFERRYDAIRIDDILERANVGRSTFYEHYKDKDALLRASIERPFTVLATAVDVGADPARFVVVLDHFWQNRDRGRSIFAGAARAPVGRVLASLIETRLAARGRAAGARLILPQRLAAIALADALLGAIAAWLTADDWCPPRELAQGLYAIAQGAAAALFGR